MPIKDLTGQRFGRLTVLKDSGERQKRMVMWLCKCDCGNFKKVRTDHLKDNRVKSCGCFHLERIKEKNSLDLTGQRYGKLLVIEKVDNIGQYTA